MGAPYTVKDKGIIQKIEGKWRPHNVHLDLLALFPRPSLRKRLGKTLIGECDQSRGKT